MEEDLQIKIIVEENNEDPIIEKDLEIKMVETIKEEIEEESFKDLNEMKSYDCQSQDIFILMMSNTPKFIDFIGVDRFDSIVSSYLIDLYNYIKNKEKEIQVDFFISLMSCKYEKKIKGLKCGCPPPPPPPPKKFLRQFFYSLVAHWILNGVTLVRLYFN